MTTAGYGATGPGQGPGDGSGGGWAAPARPAEPPMGEQPAAATSAGDARPGPLPPRMDPPRSDPHRGSAAVYPQAGSSYPPAGGTPPPAGQATPSGHWPGASSPPAQSAVPGQWSGPTPAGWPAPQQSPAAGQQPPAGYAAPPSPALPGPAYPHGGASPAPGSAWPAPAPAGGATPRPRGRALTFVAFGLALVLAVVSGVQAYQINRLSDRLADTDQRLATAQTDDATRLDGLEQRAQALEKQAGAQFNPEAVASAVLPSVFRVRAGQFTGTAFAVGKPDTGGGTNLFTNFHVVESVWVGGGREVFLERTDQRYPATIVKVDEANDIAQLRTTSKFTGLVTASTAVKPGQQIVVVGAPLGLQDSVTTGVVSAFREAGQGSGPVIQFDAPINPGNSGGPVINGQKQVVGIATAKARDAEGIGLAVPIKVACDGFRIC
ncbi:trypsin-like peptidase domain-containing protein [Micromonospora sp. WMMD956]|uniref:trypsin-like peptidase domain-containing protein n=1 Tax=Micromonospora sp. WMMD956 TaxID=3016108 RepID=UPI002417BBAF|nr:trypsin-like peptidase domain-containing protein [Micromonospora sp. WMMD956]MDG4818143.1 trypsin-like peptidase domain-containing protein [Micromonospora sp. WMMD956]